MTPERPTLDTVAQAAGVSRMTVSNAYNRPDQLSATTRERVLAAAAALGYSGPNPAGRSLRRGRAGAVGVLLTEQLSYAFSDPGMVEFMRGLIGELGAARQAVLLVPGETDNDGSLVMNAIVDAFVVVALGHNDPAVLAVRSRRLPMVTAGNPRIPNIPFVGIDNRKAAVMVAEYLLDLGHRRLGLVMMPGRDTAPGGGRGVPLRIGVKHRWEGFAGALRATGAADGTLQVSHAAANSVEGGRAAAVALLSGDPERRPTAIFAVTDVLAQGVLDAAVELGISVPDELSVVGFDDIPAAALSTPPLTTVAQSLYQQGQQAAKLALAVVAGEPARSARIKAELVIRGTTAPPPTQE